MDWGLLYWVHIHYLFHLQRNHTLTSWVWCIGGPCTRCYDLKKIFLNIITLAILLYRTSFLIFDMHRNTYRTLTCYIEEVMELRRKCLYYKSPCTFPLIPVFLLQEACPKLSQNEASPIQCALWDQRENGWVSTSLLLCVLLSAQVLKYGVLFPSPPIFWHSKKKPFYFL